MRSDGTTPDGIYNAYLNGIESEYPDCCVINYCQLLMWGLAPGNEMTQRAVARHGRHLLGWLPEYVMCETCIDELARKVESFAV